MDGHIDESILQEKKDLIIGSIPSIGSVLCSDAQALNKLKRFVRKGDLENTDE